VLASASPRRRELLEGLGIRLRVEESGVDETPGQGGGSPVDLACDLAARKARAVAGRVGHGLVLGADTLVVLEGRVLGKPLAEREALGMLTGLRGKTHQVITGVALVDASSGALRVAHVVSHVTMRHYADAEAEAFVASGGAWDKAGAYAVQDPVFQPAASVHGCYANVMGLPLCTVSRLMAEAGVVVSPPAEWRPPGPCSGCEDLAQQHGGGP
jgi:MAF protein